MFFSQWIHARNILLISPPLFFVITINFCCVSNRFVCYHRENIIIYAILIHNLCYRSDLVKCWFSIFGMSITIMNLFCAVYRESYKKMILLEKGTPPIIDQISIRLQCIIYVYPMFIILFLIFLRLFKKGISVLSFLFHRSRNSNHTSYCIILMMVL